MRSLPRAILVDLDDTIIDESGSVAHWRRTVCQRAARDAPGLDAEVLLAEIKRAADHRDAAISPFPRALETRAELVRRGFRPALLTDQILPLLGAPSRPDEPSAS